MTSTPQYHGSCLCGAINYRIDGPIKAVTHCHCSQCRKAHGAAFASYGSVPLSTVTCSDPAQLLRVFNSSPGVSRSFCSACGASVFWRNTAGQFADWTCIALGTLDTPFEPARHTHVHLQSTPCWATALLD